MANPNLDKSVLKLDTSTDDVVDVSANLTPPVLTPESEFEKLLQEETARFNLPLALRKSPRATAGMKYTLIHDEEDENQDVVFSKPAVKSVKVKEIKTSSKRKLELGSSTHPGKVKHKDKHKDKHRNKHKESESVEDYVPPSSKKQKIGALRDQDSRNDFYCWYCHKEGSVICCELCPRVYHTRCLKYSSEPEGDWVCPVCQKVLESECVDTQSKAMSRLSVSQLSRLLNYALQRMKHQGTDSFQKPVSLDLFPDYAAFVFNPMDLGTLEENIQKNIYGSTYAFLEETKWILHNSIIFNGSHHKVTSRAKSIVKICDYEMNEIEICPSCYLSSCLKRAHWFCEPCDPPHTIVWAKLQGFPHWQAKVLRESEGQVDVRFFGQHDRAWLPIQNCYVISKEPPIVSKKHSSRLSNASKELKIYVENVKAKFGSFEYAPQRTPYKLGMGIMGSVNKSPARRKSPARAVKPLSGKPASFMNGIREAEVAALEAKSEVKDTSEPAGDLPDDSVADIDQSKTRRLSESASVDEESIDSISQDSSTWSVGSGQSLEKTDKGTIGSERPVADCTAPKSRMGGMKVVVKKLNSETSKDGVPELTPKTAELTRKRFLEGEESPSKKAVPAGVFEISNESLDIDEDREKKSPSVQLLGKVHVSPKRLNRSLDSDKDKTQCVESGDDKSGIQKRLFPSPKKHAEIETDVKRMGGSQGQGGDASDKAAAEGIKNSDKVGSSHEQVAVDKSKTSVLPVKLKVDLKGQSAISVDGDSESSSISTSGNSLQSILTSKLPNPLDLDEAEITSKTAESERPSTSKGTPRNSDKFHINLSRTIETMKASLGMESMETNDNSESESESESVSGNEIEQDSDSSDAHSEGSSMEVDTKNDGEEEKTTKQDATKDNVPKTIDVNMDANSADETQLRKEDDKVKDQGSEVASDCGHSVNLNSADDQSESELVIDMDRVEGGESSSVSKEPPDQESSDKVPRAQNKLSGSEGKSTGNENESTNRTDDCSTESTSAVQENISSTEIKCDGIQRTTSEVSTPAPNVTANPEKKPQLSDNNQYIVKKDDATPSIVMSPTSILASQKLAEIVQQKEMEERKMLNSLKAAEDKCQKPETEEKMDIANIKSVANDADKDTDGKQLRGKEVEYPLEEEDPLKAWGTADELLDKYSNQVSKCVRESLTTVRRDLIDSITSVDVKNQIEQLQAQVTRLTWEKEQQKRELQHIMDLTIAEMRESLNADLKSCEASTKKEAQKEKEEAVRETKKKQWVRLSALQPQIIVDMQEQFLAQTTQCAQCEQEAFFYCCWNTSYCTYLCQQKHWSTHQNLCQQPNTQNGTQTSSQPPTTVQGTLTISTTTSSAPSTSVNATTSSTSDRLHIMSTQASQNPSIQLVQTAPVTAAQNTSNVTPQSVQTLIRYVQAPRLPLQSGTLQTQPTQQIIRLPMNQVGGQLVRTLPATIRQVGGQQQLVVSSQALQSLQAKKPVPNVYNV